MKETEQNCRVSFESPDGAWEHASLFAWEQAVEEERNVMWGAHIRDDEPVEGNGRLLALLPKRLREEVQGNDWWDGFEDS